MKIVVNKSNPGQQRSTTFEGSSLLLKKHFLAIFLFASVFSGKAFAQCKSFVKKSCMPAIKPYTHNGQMNSTVLHAGETAEMQMTFYKGQDYRILACGHEVLGDIYFNVFDLNRKTIYSSKGKANDSWDFNVTSTQDMIVEVVIPSSESGTKKQIIPSGCVSLLVGFKNNL